MRYHRNDCMAAMMLLVLFLICNRLSAQTTIWAEDWSTASRGQTPYQVDTRYASSIFKTYVKATGTAYAGGSLPELMLYSGDSLVVTLTDLKGCAGEMMLTYRSNRDVTDSPRLEVKANGKPLTVTSVGKTRTATFSVDEDIRSIRLVFTARGGNARIDNLSLTGAASTRTQTSVSFGSDVDGKTFTVYKGQEQNFSVKSATLDPVDVGELTYASTKDDVASVDASGKVTFKNYGSATITARFAGNETCAASSAAYGVEYKEDKSVRFTAVDGSFKAKNLVQSSEANYKTGTYSFVSNLGDSWNYKIDDGLCLNTGFLKFNGAGHMYPTDGRLNYNYTVRVTFFQTGKTSLPCIQCQGTSRKVYATSNGRKNSRYGNGYSAEMEFSKSEVFVVYAGSVMYVDSIIITPKETIEKTSTVLAFPYADYTVRPGQDFVSPSARLTTEDGEILTPGKGELTYTISNNDVASIDQATGILTLNTSLVEGDKATVTASFAGNENYLPSSATYTLTVGAAELDRVTLDETESIDETLTEHQGTLVDVVLKRPVSKDYVNTVCLPFDMTSSQIADAFGEGSVAMEYTRIAGGVMYFSSVEAMEAGVPYLVRATETKDEVIVRNVALNEARQETVDREEDGRHYGFCGTYSPFVFTKADGTQLFLSKSGKLLRPTTVNMRLRGMRAYFSLPQAVIGEEVSLMLDDESTGISEMVSIPLRSGHDVYNLSGQKVGETLDGLGKGLYIVNGKKYIIK